MHQNKLIIISSQDISSGLVIKGKERQEHRLYDSRKISKSININQSITRYLPKQLYIQLKKMPKVKFKNRAKWKMDHAVEILWQIQRGAVYCDWTKQQFNYVHLQAKLLQKITINYLRYLEIFLSAGFISRNNQYIKGKSCKSYSLHNRYFTGDIYFHDISDQKIGERQDNYLYDSRNLSTSCLRQKNILEKTVTIELQPALNWIDAQTDWIPQKTAAYRYVCQLISDRKFYFKEDAYGRRHHNLTNISKHIRQNYIRINGNPTVEIDIPNSQPRFLVDFINEHGIDVNRDELEQYTDLVTSGRFYEFIMDAWLRRFSSPITRDEAKKLVFKVFYDKTRTPAKARLSNYSYQQLFKGLFPTIAKCMDNYKRHNYSALSHSLQRIESNFVFKRADTINDGYYTVHDSIVVEKNNFSKYEGVLR